MYLGRIDDQIKINGFRVDLVDIEYELESHPDIKQAAVCVFGEIGSQYLVGYVVLNCKNEKLFSEMIQEYFMILRLKVRFLL